MQNISNRQPSNWQRATLLTLFVGYSGYYICRSNLSVAMPLIHDEFGLSKTQTGGIASVGVLLYALGKISNGLIADFFGGRRLFLLGMFASVVCTFLFGMTTGLIAWTIVWAANRYFQSMGWVALVKVASRWYPVHRHATILGILSMSYLIGDAFARFYLGLFIGWDFGWRGVFMVSAITLAVISLLNLFFLKDSPTDVNEPEPPANPANVFGAGGEKSRPNGLRELLGPLLRNPIFWLICAINFGLTLVRETFNLWNPTFLREVADIDAGEAAIRSLAFPLIGALSAFMAGWISDRLRGRHGRVVFPSLILLVITMTVLGTADLQGRPTLSLVLICGVSFFLIAPYSFLSGVMALDIGGKSGASTTAGLVDSAGYLGAVLSGAGIGKLVDLYGWSVAFCALAGVCGVTALIALVYWILHERAHHRLSSTTSDAPS